MSLVGVLERRLLSPEVLGLGQEPREALGEWIFSRRRRGVTCHSLGPFLPSPLLVPEHDTHLQAIQE